MFDWKKKIDDQEEAQRQARERAEAEAKARQLAAKERAEEDERQSNMRKLAQFQCSICNTPALRPETITGGGGIANDEGRWTDDNFNRPGDLWQCKNCNKWTCADHIHKGICQACAEKI